VTDSGLAGAMLPAERRCAMGALKDRLEKLMAGRDSVEIPRAEAGEDLEELRKARVRLELLDEGLEVDFTAGGVAVRRAGTKPPARDRWEALKAKVRAEIGAIDKDTPWAEVEPEWWLEMQEVLRAVSKGAEGKPEPMPGRKVLSTLFGD